MRDSLTGTIGTVSIRADEALQAARRLRDRWQHLPPLRRAYELTLLRSRIVAVQRALLVSLEILSRLREDALQEARQELPAPEEN